MIASGSLKLVITAELQSREVSWYLWQPGKVALRSARFRIQVKHIYRLLLSQAVLHHHDFPGKRTSNVPELCGSQNSFILALMTVEILKSVYGCATVPVMRSADFE